MEDENDLISQLQKAASRDAPQQDRAVAQELLIRSVNSQEIRDVEYTAGVHKAILGLLPPAWSGNYDWDELRKLYFLFGKLIALPEFSADTAKPHMTKAWAKALAARLFVEEPDQSYLRQFLHWAYMHFPKCRPTMRRVMGEYVGKFLKAGTMARSIATLLEVLGCIVKGFSVPLGGTHIEILESTVLALHTPNGMAAETLPLLATYHEPLVYCVIQYIEKMPNLIPLCVNRLLSCFPANRDGNSPKSVLLLHELEMILERMEPAQFDRLENSLFTLMSTSISSEYSRVAERCLTMFKNDKVVDLVFRNPDRAIRTLLPSLVRGFKPHWNQTVNKMSAHVLEIMKERYYDLWTAAIDDLLTRQAAELAASPSSGSSTASSPSASDESPHSDKRLRSEPGLAGRTEAAEYMSIAPGASLDPNLPPPPQRVVSSGPVKGLGVGDMAAQGTSSSSAVDDDMVTKFPAGMRPPSLPASGGKRDFLTATVAAKPQGLSTSTVPPHMAKYMTAMPSKPAVHKGGPRKTPAQPEAQEANADEGQALPSPSTLEQHIREGGKGSASLAVRRVEEYMKSLLPKDEVIIPAVDREGMNVTPTLLPNLKFHDLVFGKVLGTGSFSTVKYALQITRNVPRNAWKEFAVKEIDSKLIEELGYEGSVNREIAALRLMSHPGIARMVAAFRWRTGAYLVLEYASRGDLHSQITSVGSLSLENSRFIVGEIAAALEHVHSQGFVFGDLKPENVLLTENGHAKLTDFGAVRPFSDAAKLQLRKSRDAMNQLRDGDWRKPDQGASSEGKSKEEEEEGEAASQGVTADGGSAVNGADALKKEEEAETKEEEDLRLEGTAAYLPPEVVKGARPTTAADCWALGCVLYFCLAGRPPVWAETEAETMQSVVSFDLSNSFPESFPEVAKDLVTKLMDPNPETRLGAGKSGLKALQDHPFFQGRDFFHFYSQSPPKLEKGAVAPAPDSKWARRQNSMMWAPMPQSYTFSSSKYVMEKIEETDFEAGVPITPRLDALAE